jgi:MFS family permease
MVFGGMEVNVVAFAKEAGVLRYAGLILMAWAFGSLVAGAVSGAITWRASPAKRFRVGASLLALSLLPLPFVGHPVVLALLLTLSGIAIAPTLIASVAVTQSSVDQNRLTEALAWISTGMAAGVAIGAACRWSRDRQLGSTSGASWPWPSRAAADPQCALRSWPALEYGFGARGRTRDRPHSRVDRYAWR